MNGDAMTNEREAEILSLTLNAYGKDSVRYLAIAMLTELTNALARDADREIPDAVARAHVALDLLELLYGEDVNAEIRALLTMERESIQKLLGRLDDD